MSLRGRCFGGYRVEEEVGATPLTSAWRATELRRGLPAVLRVLAPGAMRWEDAFRAAVAAQRALIHPNRVQVLDPLEIDGRPAVVTEHVVGPSLATWLRVRRRGLPEVLGVFEDVVRGVAAVHRAGLQHLSIDAGAIWMHSRRGVFVPKVDLALGPVIAAAAADGHRIAPGRLPPLPPFDPQADLFLLGTLLFEMIDRRLPFEAADLVDGAPDPPPLDLSVPVEVRTLVARLLATRPSARPPGAEAVIAALTSPAPPGAEETPRIQPGVRTDDPVLVAAGVAAALVVIAGMVAWLG